MTHKDYENAIRVINNTKYQFQQEKEIVVKVFCDLFEGDNVRFNRQRFMGACMKPFPFNCCDK